MYVCIYVCICTYVRVYGGYVIDAPGDRSAESEVLRSSVCVYVCMCVYVYTCVCMC
jgi:hypothetical protein